MKKLLTVLFLFVAAASFGQVQQKLPQYYVSPGYQQDSVETIPLGISRLRNVAGARNIGQIRFNQPDSSVYVYNGTRWIKLASYAVTPVPQGTTTGIDSITFTAPRTICAWKHDTSTCYELASGIDSAKVVGGTLLCFYSGGVSDCYAINGNVITTTIDSITVAGTNYCWWNNNSPTCVNIDNTTPFDTTYIYDSIAKVKVGVFSGDGSIMLIDSPGRRIDIRASIPMADGLLKSMLSLSDTVVTVSGTLYVRDNKIYSLPIPTNFEIPKAATGYIRFDLIYIDSLNVIRIIKGTPDTGIAVPPAMPPGGIQVSIVSVVAGLVQALAASVSSNYWKPGGNNISSGSTNFGLTNVAPLGIITAGVKRAEFTGDGDALFYGANASFKRYIRNTAGQFKLNIENPYTNIYAEPSNPIQLVSSGNRPSIIFDPTAGTGLFSNNLTSNNIINPTAALELSHRYKGFLPSRIPTSARDSIINPAKALLIYNTTIDSFQYYNSGWKNLGESAGGTPTPAWGLTGTSGTNPLINYIGTRDNVPFRIRVNDDTAATFGTLYNISFGASAVASGFASTAMGLGSIANETASTAMGNNTVASGVISTAMGQNTVADGQIATAMGSITRARGDASTSMGIGTYSKSAYSLSIGRFNDTSDVFNDTIRLFSIGNGSTAGLGRSNILTVTNYGVAIGTITPDSSFTNQLGLWSKRGVRFSGLEQSPFDTSNYKPVVVNSSGTLSKMNWPAGGGGGSGTVTSITAGLYLSGGTITSSGTINIDTSASGLSGKYLRRGDSITNVGYTTLYQHNKTRDSLPILASGTYSPTITSVANLDAVSISSCQFLRVGNTVTVSGEITSDPTTAAGTLTRARFTLPIASNLTASAQCSGNANIGISGTAALGAAIKGDATNDQAEIAFGATYTSSLTYNFSFTYQVL